MTTNADTAELHSQALARTPLDGPKGPPSAPAGHRTVYPRAQMTEPKPAAAPPSGSVFLPLLLLALAVVVWFGVQSVQLAADYRQIRATRAGLETQTESATRLRAALDAVASATAQLANQGNPNAQAVVQELRRRGVTIDPEKALQKN